MFAYAQVLPRTAEPPSRALALRLLRLVLSGLSLDWLADSRVRHGRRGGVAKFVFLFIGLPALLALAGAVAQHRRAHEAVLGAFLAGALGALSWILTVLWLASQGVFE
jgi:hypothetical protein